MLLIKCMETIHRLWSRYITSSLLVAFILIALLVQNIALESVLGANNASPSKVDSVGIDPPQSPEPVPFVSDSLSNEFIKKYREKFGPTEIDQSRSLPLVSLSASAHEEENRFLRDEKLNREHRRFAEFMLRRVVENKFDHAANSNPRTRWIYVAKTKISDVNLSPSSRVKLNLHYSLSNNFLELTLKSIGTETRVSYEMENAHLGPNKMINVRYWFRAPLSELDKLELLYWYAEDKFNATHTHQISETMNVSLSGSYVYFHEDKPSFDQVSVSLGWIY